jgi:hypothetical protein
VHAAPVVTGQVDVKCAVWAFEDLTIADNARIRIDSGVTKTFLMLVLKLNVGTNVTFLNQYPARAPQAASANQFPALDPPAPGAKGICTRERQDSNTCTPGEVT